ncbi:pectinesterase family protein [Desertivirga arenae]|uniref:pectinesterase family protein n=1 Tax=Desertivirga arenae TaxID=2810309 RepID=UPI001A95C4A6|nr:pectinesterase family protein [Pedobacter sp. SYSU D00823]
MKFKSQKTLTAGLIAVVLLFFASFTSEGQEKKIVVAQDGSAAFKTIAEAISSIPEGNTTPVVILVKNGIYKEKLTFPKTKSNIRLIGEDVNRTILTYDDYASKKDSAGKDIGTSRSASVFVLSNDFIAENITFENSSGPVGQALAISVGGDRVFFKNCRFLGFQDTIYTSGGTTHQYFYNCYIEGTVDFIFGAATAVFEKCEIFCKRGGYITAASTPEGQKYGYIFRECKITGTAPENSFFLGRPWRPYAKVVFIKCELPALIKAEGWHNWGKESNEKTAFYAEYKNKGEGFQPDKRVRWSRQLTKKEASEYTLEEIFVDWKPGK